MKIVFFGTPDFAIPSLKSIVDSKHTLLSVVTSPDNKAGRGLKLKQSDIRGFCNRESLESISFEDYNSNDTFNYLKTLAADLFVVVAFKILPERIIKQHIKF